MHTEPSIKDIQKEWHGTLKAYIIGFVGSLVLTAISFLLVITKTLSGKSLFYTLIGLAITQAIVQLLFFLHVGQEAKPRWESLVFYFMVLVLIIVVGGSLWIMYDLNVRAMPQMPEGISHD